MKICIGIISYFPDSEVRSERVRRCQALLDKCDDLFNLPIFIVAQNWREGEVNVSDNVTLLKHERLGMTQARKVLRKLFLTTDYEYIILFDDDCVLEGTKEGVKTYLSALENSPGGYLECREMFKLSAISNAIFRQFDIPYVSVEDGTGIEDIAFFSILQNRVPDKRIRYAFTDALKETSEWKNDKSSTWSRKNIGKLISNTCSYLENMGVKICR